MTAKRIGAIWSQIAALTILIGASSAMARAQSVSANYHLSHQYPVPGDGGWDYITVDSIGRRIYASHGDRAEVLDADTGKQIGQILGTPGIHGVAVATDLNRGFTSNGGDKSVTIFDLETLRVLTKVEVNHPDFILYDSFSHHVFPLSETVSVLDGKTGNVVTQMELGGKPEAGVSDGKGTVYVNLKDKEAVAVIDATNSKVVKTYPIENCRSPHSLAYDDKNQLLFIGCREGLAVMSSTSGKIVGGSLQCSGVDSGAFDPDSRLIFESCAEGVVSVIRQITPGFYQLLDTVKTQLFAKTMAFDSKTKNIYLATADFETTLGGGEKKDPQVRIKPGSFRILVLSAD